MYWASDLKPAMLFVFLLSDPAPSEFTAQEENINVIHISKTSAAILSFLLCFINIKLLSSPLKNKSSYFITKHGDM